VLLRIGLGSTHSLSRRLRDANFGYQSYTGGQTTGLCADDFIETRLAVHPVSPGRASPAPGPSPLGKQPLAALGVTKPSPVAALSGPHSPLLPQQSAFAYDLGDGRATAGTVSGTQVRQVNLGQPLSPQLRMLSPVRGPGAPQTSVPAYDPSLSLPPQTQFTYPHGAYLADAAGLRSERSHASAVESVSNYSGRSLVSRSHAGHVIGADALAEEQALQQALFGYGAPGIPPLMGGEFTLVTLWIISTVVHVQAIAIQTTLPVAARGLLLPLHHPSQLGRYRTHPPCNGTCLVTSHRQSSTGSSRQWLP
jgi:hypothetical protein